VGGGDIGLDDFENGLKAVRLALNAAFDEALLRARRQPAQGPVQHPAAYGPRGA
jgi:hypothetical protein